MLKRLRSALSPSMAVALLALFVALGGVGIAATGGNFILGTPNTATSVTQLSASGATTTSALALTNTNTASGATALQLTAAANHAPIKTGNKTKVANLNVDALDGIDSTGFVRRGIALSHNVNPATGSGVVDVTNTGNGNGVQGKTSDGGGSAIYGEHIGPGGYGVAGRAGNSGHGVYGDNTGDGYAGYFEDRVHVGGNLELDGSLVCPAACVAPSSISGKVNDSDKLDGLDSAAFVQGVADGQAIAEGPSANNFLGPAFGGFVRLQYQCPSPVGGNGVLRIINSSAGIGNFFIDSGGANPDYIQLGSGGLIAYPASAGGESFEIQAQGAPGVLTIQAATVDRAASNDCHAQAQGLLTP